MLRADVEAAIRDEELALDEVIRLLDEQVALVSWPEGMRNAFTLAVEPSRVGRTESWKVVSLRRHLFGPDATSPLSMVAVNPSSATDRRRAERLRSDLPARVRYRCGRYLLRP